MLLFDLYINLGVLFNAKVNTCKKAGVIQLNHNWSNKGVQRFSKCFSPKLNIIERLEFELAHLEAIVQYLRHYVMPPIVNE